MTQPPTLVLRARTTADLPALVAGLAEQQSASRYPMRWPLPFPAEDFISRPNERAAWVAVAEDGAVVGHVAVLEPVDDTTGRAFRDLSGREDVLEVGVLFTTLAARGHGAGGLLLDRAVRFAREQGALPVLDVLPTHPAALALYRRRGWRELGRVVPEFLPVDLPGGRPDMILMSLPPDT